MYSEESVPPPVTVQLHPHDHDDVTLTVGDLTSSDLNDDDEDLTSSSTVDEVEPEPHAQRIRWSRVNSIDVAREISRRLTKVAKEAGAAETYIDLIRKRIVRLQELSAWFSGRLSCERLQEIVSSFRAVDDDEKECEELFQELQCSAEDQREAVKRLAQIGPDLVALMKTLFEEAEAELKKKKGLAMKPDCDLNEVQFDVFDVEQLKTDMAAWQRSVGAMFSVFEGIGSLGYKTRISNFLKVIEQGKKVFENLACVHEGQRTKLEKKETKTTLEKRYEEYENQLQETTTALEKHERDIHVLENNLIPADTCRLQAAADEQASLKEQLNQARQRIHKLGAASSPPYEFQALLSDLKQYKELTAELQKEMAGMEEYTHSLRVKLRSRKQLPATEHQATTFSMGELAVTSEQIFGGGKASLKEKMLPKTKRHGKRTRHKTTVKEAEQEVKGKITGDRQARPTIVGKLSDEAGQGVSAPSLPAAGLAKYADQQKRPSLLVLGTEKIRSIADILGDIKSEERIHIAKLMEESPSPAMPEHEGQDATQDEDTKTTHMLKVTVPCLTTEDKVIPKSDAPEDTEAKVAPSQQIVHKDKTRLRLHQQEIKHGLRLFQTIREDLVSELKKKDLLEHASVIQDLTACDVEESEDMGDFINALKDKIQPVLEDFEDVVSNAFRRLKEKEDPTPVITQKPLNISVYPLKSRGSSLEAEDSVRDLLQNKHISAYPPKPRRPSLEAVDTVRDLQQNKSMEYAFFLACYQSLWTMYSKARSELIDNRSRPKRTFRKVSVIQEEEEEEEEIVPTIVDAQPHSTPYGPPKQPDIIPSSCPRGWKEELSVAKEALDRGVISFKDYETEVTCLLKLAELMQHRSSLLGDTSTEIRMKASFASKTEEILEAVGLKNQSLREWQRRTGVLDYSAKLSKLDRMERRVRIDYEHTRVSLAIMQQHEKIRNKLQSQMEKRVLETIMETSESRSLSKGSVSTVLAMELEAKEREREERVKAAETWTSEEEEEEIMTRLHVSVEELRPVASGLGSPFVDQTDLPVFMAGSGVPSVASLGTLEELSDKEDDVAPYTLPPWLSMPDLIPQDRSLLYRPPQSYAPPQRPGVAGCLPTDVLLPPSRARQSQSLGLGKLDARYQDLIRMDGPRYVHMGMNTVRTMVSRFKKDKVRAETKSLALGVERLSTSSRKRPRKPRLEVPMDETSRMLDVRTVQPQPRPPVVKSPRVKKAVKTLRLPSAPATSPTLHSSMAGYPRVYMKRVKEDKEGIGPTPPPSSAVTEQPIVHDKVTLDGVDLKEYLSTLPRATTWDTVERQDRRHIHDKLQALHQLVERQQLTSPEPPSPRPHSAVERVRGWVQEVGLKTPASLCPQPVGRNVTRLRRQQNRRLHQILTKHGEDQEAEAVSGIDSIKPAKRPHTAGWRTHKPGKVTIMDSKLFCLDIDQAFRKARRTVELVSSHELSKVRTDPGCQHIWNKFQLSCGQPLH